MISVIHNSIELMRALHQWWRSIYTKDNYDITVRLKKDEYPYFENITIPSAYKIKQEAKSSIVKKCIKENFDFSEYGQGYQHNYNIDGDSADTYIIGFRSTKGTLNINFDESIQNGTQIDFLLRASETTMYGIISTHAYFNISGNVITGALPLTTSILGASYDTSGRYYLDISISVEKLNDKWIVTSFIPMPTYTVKKSGQHSSIYYNYGGNFKDPFDV